jgi:hypothetical protein
LSAAPWAERELGGHAKTTFRAVFAELGLCGVALDGVSADVVFCAGAQPGVIRAESTGLFQNRITMRPVMQLRLGANLQLAVLRQHALLFGVGAGIPLLTETYRFVERDESERVIHVVQLGVFGEIGWLWHISS